MTLLFADIEGSTRLVQQLDTGYAAVRDAYQSIVREAIETHAGHEMGTEGDSFFVVFDRAADAVACAVRAQAGIENHDWPVTEPVRVRVGIHTGEAVPRGDGYVGVAVHQAARVASAANGGQILLTEATRTLAANAPPSESVFADLGAHRLKDLDRPLRLYELRRAGGAPGPRPRTLDAQRHHLPTHLTPFTGREAELDTVTDLIADPAVRLLTLIGPGGTGKSRLAARVAEHATARFPDGVWFVPLASVSDPAAVPSAVGQTIGADESAHASAADAVFGALGDKRALLVLDNLEHLMEATAFINDVLHAAPNVDVLITSREPLRSSAERLYQVPPMVVPDPAASADDAARADAVALFVDRVSAREPAFRLDATNARDVIEICRRLDGLPLAIELAASRVPSLGVRALREKLDEGLAVLGGGPDDSPERHRTLDAAIAWSYDMLDAHEQQVFRQLAVFNGGWDAAAAAAVADASQGDLDALVERSLLRRDLAIANPRFTMLATIREFAQRRLAGSGEAELAAEKHTAYFNALAARAEAEIHRQDAGRWLDLLGADVDDLRTVMDRLWELGRNDEAAAMAASLADFWKIRGFLEQGRERLELAHERAGEASIERARCAVALARLRRETAISYVPKAMIPALEEAVEIATAVGDERCLARALAAMAGQAETFRDGFVAGYITGEAQKDETPRPKGRTKRQRRPKARSVLQRALAIAERCGDDVLIAEIRSNPSFHRGFFKKFRALSGDPRTVSSALAQMRGGGDKTVEAELLVRSFGSGRAREVAAERGLELARELGDQRLEAQALGRLADFAGRRADLKLSSDLLHQGIAVARSVGDKMAEGRMLFSLAIIGSHWRKAEAVAAIRARLAQMGRSYGWVGRSSLMFTAGAYLTGLRTFSGGALWIAAFAAFEGRTRHWLLLAAGSLLLGRVRNLVRRPAYWRFIHVRHSPLLIVTLAAFGLALWLDRPRLAALGLFVVLAVFAWMRGPVVRYVTSVCCAAGIVATYALPIGSEVVPILVVIAALPNAFSTLDVQRADPLWRLSITASVIARIGATFVGVDVAARLLTGSSPFGTWGRVGAPLAVAGLVTVTVVAVFLDRRLRVPAAMLAVGSALLPFSFAGSDPSAVAAGVIFGVAWVVAAALLATEPLDAPEDFYPSSLQGPPKPVALA